MSITELVVTSAVPLVATVVVIVELDAVADVEGVPLTLLLAVASRGSLVASALVVVWTRAFLAAGLSVSSASSGMGRLTAALPGTASVVDDTSHASSWSRSDWPLQTDAELSGSSSKWI